MSKYRKHLPQLGDSLFVTDGGLETTLVFHEGLELCCLREPVRFCWRAQIVR